MRRLEERVAWALYERAMRERKVHVIPWERWPEVEPLIQQDWLEEAQRLLRVTEAQIAPRGRVS